MPDDRLARARRSLPAGYQFGDARPGIAIRFVRDWDIQRSSFPWRPLHENAAAQLTPRHYHVWRDDIARNALVCDCGVLRAAAEIWNVIEGEHHE